MCFAGGPFPYVDKGFGSHEVREGEDVKRVRCPKRTCLGRARASLLDEERQERGINKTSWLTEPVS